MNNHTPLIELKHNRLTSQGAVFFFPGSGDSITSFISLVNEQNHGLPVYGLQPRGLDPQQEPYVSMDEMIDVYMKSICAKQNRGPYYLLGHSFGGFIALEIARRLHAQGCVVKSVIMLDVSPPENPHIHLSRVECLLELIQTMELASSKPFNLTAKVLEPLSEEDQLLLLHKRMVATGVLPNRSTVDSIRGMVRVFIANEHMEYWPKEKYQGEALLINALDKKENNVERQKQYLRWKSHVPKLGYQESPGNHITLLDSLNIKVLAEIIAKHWALS